MNIEFTKLVNPELLTEELKAVLGEAVQGLFTTDDVVTIVMSIDNPTQSQRDRVRQVVEAHDRSLKSEWQQEQEAVEAQREEFLAAPLNVETFDDDALLRQLAERVAWLERELARLVG
jgi:hypothetical protein